jgi:tRNA G10  N-methylase Trm11
MKYFFILGRQSELCAAEVEAKLNQLKIDFKLVLSDPHYLIIESSQNIDGTSLINKLGGTIKIGIIEKESANLSAETLYPLIPKTNKKIHLGLSTYGFTTNITKLGLELKKILHSNDYKARFVSSKENPLSSVIVQKNHLLDQGAELICFKTKSNYLFGRTLSVQPFETLSKLDYGRPATDTYSGMLPPKLAQIMINLSESSEKSTLYDPFCGSGTVLQQALMLGYKKVIGSDISPKAVADTKENLQWLSENFNTKNNSLVFLSDVTRAVKMPNTVETIVTEPYLGPALRGHEEPEQIQKNIQPLLVLYKKTLTQFEAWLKKGGVAIIILPKFQIKKQNYSIDITQILPSRLKVQGHWEYGREGQIVAREIYKLKRI